MRLLSSERLSRWLASAAGLSLLVMLLITVSDVLMRNLKNQPILGATEIVQLTLVYVVFLGIPETFLKRSHVTVDVADHVFGPRVIHWLNVISGVVTFALLVVMLWMMWVNARDAYDLGDTTSDLTMPLTWFWAPMIVGGACSIIAVFVLVLRDLRQRSSGEH